MIELENVDCFNGIGENPEYVINIFVDPNNSEQCKTAVSLAMQTPDGLYARITKLSGSISTELPELPFVLIDDKILSPDEYLDLISHQNRWHPFVFDGKDLFEVQYNASKYWYEHIQASKRMPSVTREEDKLSPEEEWEWFGQHGDD